MKIRIDMSVDYEADPNEDIGAVERALAEIVAEQDGVHRVLAHAEPNESLAWTVALGVDAPEGVGF